MPGAVGHGPPGVPPDRGGCQGGPQAGQGRQVRTGQTRNLIISIFYVFSIIKNDFFAFL